MLRFSKCIGLPKEGFEEEIEYLMIGVSERMYKDKGKGVHGSTRFDRELKRLEWALRIMGDLELMLLGKGRGFLTLVFMKMKILLWNDRGANNAKKRKKKKAYLKVQKVDLVCF